MAERSIQNDIRVAASKGPTRLFRNNTGMGWQGKVLRREPGKITLADPRPLHAGLCEGSADLIGWSTVVITPEMVGQKVAVFTAIEVKDKGAATAEQKQFIKAVQEFGGIGGIARSIEDAAEILGTGFPANPLL